MMVKFTRSRGAGANRLLSTLNNSPAFTTAAPVSAPFRHPERSPPESKDPVRPNTSPFDSMHSNGDCTIKTAALE
jgi:hypothetical protein